MMGGPCLDFETWEMMNLIDPPFGFFPVQAKNFKLIEFPGLKCEISTPRTKTCPFTPASKARSLGTPNPWGPRPGAPDHPQHTIDIPNGETAEGAGAFRLLNTAASHR